MTDLLELVLDAHGGLDNWRKVTTVDLRLTLRGHLLGVKQHPDGIQDALVKISARRPRTMITPFPHRGSRGIFEDGKVQIQTDEGVMTSELERPRKSFEGHQRLTPWSDLQFLYFLGYAFWNYFTTPFLLAGDGVSCREIEPHQENGEEWRVLQAVFEPNIDTHCAEQKFYFDSRGLLQRHDYFTDVGRGNAAHYTYDHRVFDGFVFPTHRRVVARETDDRAALSGRSTFLVDIDSVVVIKE
jgi:hypothetical protein